ncbi:MAG: hypothetical protein GY785_00280 [Gammaproteobacteria bacterium]|nr:hypothetical protein [Gammaproteobacteria bacterium]
MCGLAIILLLLSTASLADEVRIVEVSVECPGSCIFAVTLEHADQGWSHYANQWDVMTLDDKLLGSRVLYHPHDNEQPFTRSLSGVTIPSGVSQVKIRAKDLVHGYSPQEFLVDIPAQ